MLIDRARIASGEDLSSKTHQLTTVEEKLLMSNGRCGPYAPAPATKYAEDQIAGQEELKNDLRYRVLWYK